jgi:hypothetical protein
MTRDEVMSALRMLEERDLVGTNATCGAIVYAYPFAERNTGHRVELRGRVLNALCAIDALGVGAMCRCDVTIASACRHCETSIHLVTAESGRDLYSASPDNAVVWYDVSYEKSAAASCCPAIAFFCSDDHLQQWLTAQMPRRFGSRLTLDEALQIGRAIFQPVLQVK